MCPVPNTRYSISLISYEGIGSLIFQKGHHVTQAIVVDRSSA